MDVVDHESKLLKEVAERVSPVDRLGAAAARRQLSVGAVCSQTACVEGRHGGSPNPGGVRNALDKKAASELLPIIEERRRSTVELIYESPALSLAAQAFLFVIALDRNTSGLGRLLASVVGAFAAAATALAILKHNYTEEMYASVVDRCQDTLGSPRLHRKELEAIAHGHGDNPYFERWKTKRWRQRILRFSATDFWIRTLMVFFAVDLLVLVLALLQLFGVANPLS